MYSPPQIIKSYISFRLPLIKRVELTHDVVTFLHSTKEQSMENCLNKLWNTKEPSFFGGVRGGGECSTAKQVKSRNWAGLP
jgi:hypothetical protein